MKAVQYAEVGSAPEVVTVPDPEPGPGQVLLKVTAAGVCHSDIAVMSWPETPFPLPLTLGHEGAGTVEAVGEGVTGLELGESVAVYGPWGCGTCLMCSRGSENYCLRAGELGIMPPGLGAPGAIAEYMLVDDPRHLVPLKGLDPVQNVSLTDAGLTPYHAIKGALPKLVPGSSAVVIGTGGLGHVAVQLLRALSPARVIALDVSKEKRELARKVGAHEALPSDESAAEKVRGLTGGVEAVFDFVGIQQTVELATAVAGVESDVLLVGVGGGVAKVGFGIGPYDMSVRAPYWGSRSELIEVLELARAGVVDVHVETYGIDEAPKAYERLHAGKINGRAVILPNG
ncbi:NAD(P)-dependent alcohol dehydrogenase [Actinomadura sp. 9N407]|uniref:NAD(P)-dependent alcohol dehydrogenase n=1 Tax=Actinomadura sp. 9N407 TaxID=3375154 RepID=UPI003791D3F3